MTMETKPATRALKTGRPTTTSSPGSTSRTRSRSGTSSASKCPIAHTERWGGSWMPTRYEDLFAIAQDIQHFSSRDVLVAAVMPAPDDETSRSRSEEEQELIQQYNVGAPPITSDPPVHTWARKLLLPPFSVNVGREVRSRRRASCAATLIDGFIDNGRADAAADYAQQIPPRVIASMLGIPKEMAATFTEWVRGFLELGLHEPGAARASRRRSIFVYLIGADPGPQGEPRATT